MGRATFWQQTRVLLWKNATLKRRNMRALITEVAVPILILLFLSWLGGFNAQVAGVENVPEARNTERAQALPTLQLLPTLLQRTNRVLGVASPRATDFIAFLDARYAVPGNASPTFGAVTTVFASVGDMDAYAKQSMTSNTTRALFAGVVLDGSVATIRLSDELIESNGAAPSDGVAPPSDFGVLAQLANKTTTTMFPGFLPLLVALHEFLAEASAPVSCDSLARDLRTLGLSWTDVHLSDAATCHALQGGPSQPSWFAQGGVVQPFPVAAHVAVTDPLTPQIVMYLVYLGMWPFARFVRDAVTEKETKMKEFLFIIGVRESALLCSWVGFYKLYALVTAIAATLLFQGVLFASGAFAFGLLFGTFLVTAVCFGLVVIPFFNRTKTAMGVAPLLFVAWCSPLIAQRMALTGNVWTLFAAVTSPVVFFNAMVSVTGMATSGNLSDVALASIAVPWLTLVAQAVGYALLGAYLDRVMPKTIGVSEPWHFPFHASFWAPTTCPRRSNVRSYHTFPAADAATDTTADDDVPVVELQNVSKTYTDGKVAVRDLSLTIPEGEIFGLLGANGAGKTTTLSMLSGLLAPTDGQLRVCGDADMSRIRQHLGVCFQQDVLYDHLTIQEHVLLLEQLKGRTDTAAVAAECAAKCAAFGLSDKLHAQSHTLSGGSKRKVCVLLALLGDARLVLLDEPTTGIDIESQKSVWAAVQGALAGRAVLLTTHAMQEAHVLSHRIGIMADGQLHAVGSSGALRDTYGVGYKLHVVKSTPDAASSVRGALTTVPGAVVLRDHKWGVDCRLPLGAEAAIPHLLHALDDLQGAGVIETYDVATTTLEDVFVKISTGDGAPAAAPADDKAVATAIPRPEAHKYASWRVFAVQVATLWRKKARFLRRDVRNTLSQFLYPALFVGVLSYALVQAGHSADDAVPSLATPLVVAATASAPSLPPALSALSAVHVGNGSTSSIVDYLLDHRGLTGAIAVNADMHTLLFNASVPGALAATVAGAYAAACGGAASCVLQVHARPLEMKSVGGAEALALSDILGVLLGMYLLGGLVYAATPVATGIVKERETGLKQYQHFCGAWLSSYWVAHATFDWAALTTFATVLALWCQLLQSLALVPIPNLAPVSVCLITSAVAIVPHMYLVSFFFGSATSAHTFIANAGTFQLLFAPVTLALTTLSGTCTGYAQLRPWLHAAFPLVALGETLVQLATSELEFLRVMCVNGSVLQSATNLTQTYVAQSVVAGACYLALVIALDAAWTYPATVLHRLRCGHAPPTGGCMDVDGQAAHAQDVGDYDEEGARPVIAATGLTKTYFASWWRRRLADVHALADVDFTVAPGESVALLGVNGSGKSTTFQILTAGIVPTAGTATVGPCDVSTAAPSARDWMGYCPQPNWLFDQLTVREHLELVCALRLQSPATIDAVLTALQLTPVAHLGTAKLSGGNKRRVMIAMAVVGRPPVLLLDEPSAGVDVVARRLLWHLLRDEACLFTTHCLEEAEAVCTSAVVLAKGRRVYRGTIARLKQQVSKGVTLNVTFRDPLAAPDVQAALQAASVEEAKALLPSAALSDGDSVVEVVRQWRVAQDVERFRAKLEAAVGPTRVLEQYDALVSFEVNRPVESRLTLANLFELAESAKDEFNLERYSISELALDQVFHHLTDE
ncbi:ATP-binding Cassette (ABC) Superfamily [Achlya hypogyna]|uniref:ATP-binding Cassette (ABC) Superfamily n=1 Tax=Achlya hypogyna TaxID=1202772 RepID=A0A1V9ZU58_ACHHY|nr:ATP-binding Cassette (ABC) Superfamily [Achlya hypogyna]